MFVFVCGSGVVLACVVCVRVCSCPCVLHEHETRFEIGFSIGVNCAVFWHKLHFRFLYNSRLVLGGLMRGWESFMGWAGGWEIENPRLPSHVF